MVSLWNHPGRAGESGHQHDSAGGDIGPPRGYISNQNRSGSAVRDWPQTPRQAWDIAELGIDLMRIIQLDWQEVLRLTVAMTAERDSSRSPATMDQATRWLNLWEQTGLLCMHGLHYLANTHQSGDSHLSSLFHPS